MSQSVGAPPRLFMVTVGHSVAIRIGTRRRPSSQETRAGWATERFHWNFQSCHFFERSLSSIYGSSRLLSWSSDDCEEGSSVLLVKVSQELQT